MANAALTELWQDVEAIRMAQADRDLVRYRGHPVAYAKHVLGVDLWLTQQRIAKAIHRPPYKVMASACHNVGKTFLAAVLTSYWFDVFPAGSAVITTAPTARDVKELLWREVRLLRNRVGLGGFAGSRAPELWDNDDHYAKGYTAERGEMFVGRHLSHMLFIFDEGCLLDGSYFTTTKSMHQPDGNHAWLVIGNPTDTSSAMFQEWNTMTVQGEPAWGRFSMSAVDHPNIKRQLQGKSLRYKSAVTLSQFESWLSDWADPVPKGDEEPTDFCWPPERNCGRCGGTGGVESV